MRLAENVGNGNGRWHCCTKLKYLNFCKQNLQLDVTLILKRLMHGENMTDLDNEKVINLEQ